MATREVSDGGPYGDGHAGPGPDAIRLAADVATAGEAGECDKVMTWVREQLDMLDLRRGRAALRQCKLLGDLQRRMEAMELNGAPQHVAQLAERVGAVEPLAQCLERRFADLGAHFNAEGAAQAQELADAFDRLASPETDSDSMSDTVRDVSAQIGDVRMSDVLAAVNSAAVAQNAEAEKLAQRLGASEAPVEAAHQRLTVLEPQMRAAERAVQELWDALSQRFEKLSRDVGQLCVADALFPHLDRSRGPSAARAAAPAEAAPRREPERANEVEKATLAHLARPELCRLRTASLRHAFLPGLGTEPPP